MKKIFIIGLIAYSFFAISISQAFAVEPTITINDSTGDVFDYHLNKVITSSPNINVNNIDIKKVTYSRQDRSVILILQVNGNIQNLGHFSDIDADYANLVSYNLVLYNDNGSYNIYYVNNEGQITYDTEEATENITPSSFSAVGPNLTVSFNLLNNDETNYSVYAETSYYNKVNATDENYEDLYDAAPDDIGGKEINVTISAPSGGEVGQNMRFSGSESGGESPINWSWDFGDGGTANTQNAIHAFDSTGTYKVNLYVTDTNFNQGAGSFNVVISESRTNNSGDNGGKNKVESSNSGLFLFVAIIAIIAIVGIAIVVYIIKR